MFINFICGNYRYFMGSFVGETSTADIADTLCLGKRDL
jgi:hypothetical protein